MVAYPVSASDVVNLTEVPLARFTGVATDFVRVQDFLNGGIGRQVSINDIINLAPVQTALTGIYMLEQINISQSELITQYLHFTLAERLNLHDALAQALPVKVSDVVNIAPVQLVAFAAQVLDKLGLSDILSSSALMRLSIAEQINLASAIARFFGAAVTDVVNLHEVTSALGLANAVATDVVNLHDTITPQFVLRVVAADVVNLTSTQVLRQILHGTLKDGIQISAAYVAPNGSITVWAMNTRNAAVTEYRNYPFNSFARMGHKYFGAAADGLYELDGDTDNGTSIIATIKTGLAQMSASHLGGIKAAYLAARGTGSWVLRIITGHGEVYNYGVTNQSMRSTKIHIGKGLRARYFAFELVSSGQDFDLDSLEFIPIVNDRRV